jgi:hypothetical protein
VQAEKSLLQRQKLSGTKAQHALFLDHSTAASTTNEKAPHPPGFTRGMRCIFCFRQRA